MFHNPLLAYNVAVLLSFPLCGIAAYALAFELTGRHDAAWLAGLAFAFSPYRANEFGHLQMLSYFWAPVALLALHRYYAAGMSGGLPYSRSPGSCRRFATDTRSSSSRFSSHSGFSGSQEQRARSSQSGWRGCAARCRWFRSC